MNTVVQSVPRQTTTISLAQISGTRVINREVHYSAKLLASVCNHISRHVIMFCILRVLAQPTRLGYGPMHLFS